MPAYALKKNEITKLPKELQEFGYTLEPAGARAAGLSIKDNQNLIVIPAEDRTRFTFDPAIDSNTYAKPTFYALSGGITKATATIEHDESKREILVAEFTNSDGEKLKVVPTRDADGNYNALKLIFTDAAGNVQPEQEYPYVRPKEYIAKK